MTIMLPAPISKAELPIGEIGTAMVTAKLSETTSVECGGRRKVLLYRPRLSTGREHYWHLGWTVWPTEASVQGWR
jgi:hypothetical protein